MTQSEVDLTKLRWHPPDLCRGFEKFEKEATEYHLGKFKYFKEYFRTRSDTTVIQCTICKSFSYPVGVDHLRRTKPGKGCRHCYDLERGALVSLGKGGSFQDFLRQVPSEKAKDFVFHEETWVNATTPFKVTHLKCGSTCTPLKQNFIHSEIGCRHCANELSGMRRRTSPVELIRKCSERHAEKYDYSLISELPLGMHSEISVICHERDSNGVEHGRFQQVAYDHLGGHGCDKCGRTVSEMERDLASRLASYGLNVETGVNLLGKQLDVYLPEFRIAIEFDGLKWHSDEFKLQKTYHLRKTLEAEQWGIRLIHVFEDEWIKDQAKCMRWLLSQCGISDLYFNARELTVGIIPWKLAEECLEDNHMQGAGVATSATFGLVDPITEQVVSVMCFDSRNSKDGEIELTRFCSYGIVRGGFSKLLKYAINNLPKNITSIVSFSERRWSQGNVYGKNGFSLESLVRPSYWWVKRGVRLHRRWGQRSNLERVFTNFDPILSESENCRANGYFKIWDCGKVKWRLPIVR